MNPIIDKYIHDISKQLRHEADPTEFLSDLKSNLEEYVSEFPESAYEDLVERFGSPKTVASEYLGIQEPGSPPKPARKKALRRVIPVSAAAAIALLLWCGVSVSSHSVAETEDTLSTDDALLPSLISPGSMLSINTETNENGSYTTDWLTVYEDTDESQSGLAYAGGGSWGGYASAPQGVIGETKSTVSDSSMFKTATRTYTAYDSSGEELWSLTLTGVFVYDGSTSSAVSSSIEYTEGSDWTYADGTAAYSRNVASVTAEFEHLTSSMSVNIGIRCQPDGTISSVNWGN